MMNISEAEAVVMEALWQRHPLSSEDLVAELGPRQSWQPATVKTLLNRLLNKGAVTASRDGRRYWYSPRLRREDWLAEQSTGLVDRLFGGSLAPLVAHFSSSRTLSPADLQALKDLIKAHEDEPR